MLPPWTALGLWGQEEGRVSLPVSVQAETRVTVRSQLYSQESSGTGQQVRAQRPRPRSSPELVWKTGPRINYPCPSPCVSYEGFERNRRGYETGAVSELSAARGGLSSIRLGVDACHPGLVTHSGHSGWGVRLRIFPLWCASCGVGTQSPLVASRQYTLLFSFLFILKVASREDFSVFL